MQNLYLLEGGSPSTMHLKVRFYNQEQRGDMLDLLLTEGVPGDKGIEQIYKHQLETLAKNLASNFVSLSGRVDIRYFAGTDTVVFGINHDGVVRRLEAPLQSVKDMLAALDSSPG